MFPFNGSPQTLRPGLYGQLDDDVFCLAPLVGDIIKMYFPLIRRITTQHNTAFHFPSDLPADKNAALAPAQISSPVIK